MTSDSARAQLWQYLQGEAQTMQLATVSDNMPWIATVYFVAHNEKLYWLSWPERRHSKELVDHQNVAAAIVVKPSQPVVGVQIAGNAKEVTQAKMVQGIMELYVAKYQTGEKFYDAFVAGTNKHHVYELVPTEISLFDEASFPGVSPVKIM